MKIGYLPLLLAFIFSSCDLDEKAKSFSEKAAGKLKSGLADFTSVILTQEHKGHAGLGTKIPIYPERWYQLVNAGNGLEGLFDGNTKETVNTGWGKVLENYDAWYPIPEGEELTIESVRFYDGKGTFREKPMTLSVITDKWERIPVATFTGEKYNTWVGPYPDSEASEDSLFRLKAPVKNPRYLVINTWGPFPAEMELYGSFKEGPSLPVKASINRAYKLKNAFGINAFEWDVVDGGKGSIINEEKLQALKNFTAIRHYMDWNRLETNEGVYAFNPTISGGWDYDLIYKRLKAEGIDVLACLKTIPKWMQITYPEGKRSPENAPLKYGKDLSDPASYIGQARVAFQYTARYGSNSKIDTSLIRNVLAGKVYPGAKNSPVRTKEVGLNLVSYIECDNERDKWWKGREGYQTAREYAANLSAFYDGHKNTLGPGVGVKNADPEMKVVIGGLTGPNIDYLKGMIDWCKEFRGYKPDGSVDLCWDIVNYHHYSSNGHDSQGASASRGAAPELSSVVEGAKQILEVTHKFSEGMPVWISELGFDANQKSPMKAIPIGDKSVLETQADWILRSALLYARMGVEKVFFYQLYDDNSGSATKFATMGLVNKKDRKPKPAADYLRQVNELLGEYTFQETISEDPIVDRYELNGESAYVLLVPDERGRQAGYKLNLDKVKNVKIYYPMGGQEFMNTEEKHSPNGEFLIYVTETPIFVVPLVK